MARGEPLISPAAGEELELEQQHLVGLTRRKLLQKSFSLSDSAERAWRALNSRLWSAVIPFIEFSVLRWNEPGAPISTNEPHAWLKSAKWERPRKKSKNSFHWPAGSENEPDPFRCFANSYDRPGTLKKGRLQLFRYLPSSKGAEPEKSPIISSFLADQKQNNPNYRIPTRLAFSAIIENHAIFAIHSVFHL